MWPSIGEAEGHYFFFGAAFFGAAIRRRSQRSVKAELTAGQGSVATAPGSMS